jgi:hypothetical protein
VVLCAEAQRWRRRKTAAVATAANCDIELSLNSRDLGLKDRQVRLGGEIVVGGFAQGFGERLGLLGREPALVPQRAEEATRI